MAAFAADEGAEDDPKVQRQALALKVDQIQPNKLSLGSPSFMPESLGLIVFSCGLGKRSGRVAIK